MDGLQAVVTTQGTQSTGQTKTNVMGKDDFLTMFLVQLKNQDPLNPMQAQEMASQLAQFSSLEQLFNVNENLQSLITSQDESSRLQALDFIGKEVVANGDSLALEKGKTAAARFELDEAADCTAIILNGDGYKVRTIPLGVLSSGSHSFQWDGHDGAGNLQDPGTYRFGILARTETGKILSVDSQTSGKVTGVNLENGTVRLYIGQVPVSISDVLEIVTPAAQEGNVSGV